MGLAVRLVGTLQALHGVPPAVVEIGSAKERRLLAALRPQTATPDRLADALWPTEPPRRPAAGVATLVSRLRTRLGPDVVLGDHRGYRLAAPPSVVVDLDEAEALLGEAGRRSGEGAPGLAGAAAERARALLEGEDVLLGESDAPWVGETRDRWRELCRAAAHRVAEAALGVGDPARALAAAGAAIGIDPYDEAALRLLMAAEQAAGRPARAVSVYLELRARLADELGIEPAPATRAAYLAVLRERPTTSRRAPTAPARALVGRDDETALLDRSWDRACGGRAGLVLAVGEAGIGKTRLLARLIDTAEATGARVASSRCHAAERSLFLQPAVDALGGMLASLPVEELRGAAQHHARVLAWLLPELADQLGAEEPDGRAPDARRVFEAVGALLRSLTAQRPLLLVLDDLHNAGLATVELLSYLARRVGRAHLLVAGGVRLEEGAAALEALDDAAHRIDLGPLSPDAVAELARRAGHEQHAEEIQRRTRGHSLFVVEILRGLRAGRQGVPTSLQAAVTARVSSVGPDVDELLRAGAVLGASVDPEVVARLIAVDPVEAVRRCERAAAARLLIPVDGIYEFANDLLHEVLYATTPAPVRRTHHRRAADVLSATPEAVGAHAAAVKDWPRAARALLLAGTTAGRRGAVGDAETLLDQALDAARRAGEAELVGRVLIARARARECLETFDGAWDDLRSAVTAAREAGDRRLEMAALRQLGGDVPMALGRAVAESTARLRESLRLAERLGDRRAEADVRARLAVVATHRLAFTEALDEGARAVDAGRGAGEDGALVIGLDGLKTALAYLGHVDDLASVVAEMEPLVRRADDRWYLHWTVFESAFVEVAAGRFEDARARIDEAVRANRRSGYPGHEAWFVAHLGWVARLQGRPDEAIEHGRRAVALTGDAGHRWWYPTAQALLASSLLEAGHVAEARSIAAGALALLGPDAVAACRVRCLAVMAEADSLGGPDEAPAALVEADRMLRGVVAPPGSAWLLGADAYLSVARAWRALGRCTEAGYAVAPLATAAARHGWSPLSAAVGELGVGVPDRHAASVAQ
ncbi:MAG TPA: AAA family ATPase [Actinomycetospora sp.]|uniref:ATP-binding protein n=1 Tax=Actinomycetospora sp. TaxID=1872135 RepID=UPI002F3FFF8C